MCHSVYMHVRFVHVLVYMYMCTYVFIYQREHLVAYHSDTDPLVRSEPGNRRLGPDPNSYSQRTRYTSDSKTSSWDNSEVRTGSCSEDQTAIRNQNQVISCECLFLCIFLFIIISRHLYITCIISCDHLIYFTILTTCITS